MVDRLNGRIYQIGSVEKAQYKVTDGYGHEILAGDLYETSAIEKNSENTDIFEKTVSDGNVVAEEKVLSEKEQIIEWIEWEIEPFGLVMGENDLIFNITLDDGTSVEEKYQLINYEMSNADAIGLNADDDEDGLSNYIELCCGTDKNDKDTDDDQLWDSYEVLFFLTDPTNPDSDLDGIIDGEEDLDGDGLSNKDEILYGTNPGVKDSDTDDLLDGEEVHVYGTNPTEPDTDKDGLDDGAEIKLGTDPLIPDSDGDGIEDGQERFEQVTELEFDEECAITEVSVTMSCPGLMEDHVDIRDIMGENVMASEMLGLVGDPIKIHSDVEFDQATITFTYDPELLGEDTTEDQLGIFWYDEENGEFVVMEDAVLDKENHTISYVTDHFSVWAVGNHEEWEAFWEIHKSITFNGDAILEKGESFDIMIGIDYSATKEEVEKEKEIAKKLINEMSIGIDRVSIGAYWSENSVFYTTFTSSKKQALAYLDGFEEWVRETYKRYNYPFGPEGTYAADAEWGVWLLTQMARNAKSSKTKVGFLINTGKNEDLTKYIKWNTGTNIDSDLKKLNCTVISYSITTKINKKMDEILSKHGGVSYYKYSDYKLIRNCAFGSRTEALLDSDDDGIYDIHEQGGIALPSGKIIYTNPCDDDTDHDKLPDNKEIYITYGEIKDGKIPVKCYYVSDPSDPDTDGDRLSDYDESIYGKILTNTLDKDTDDDGFFDGLEIYYGFDPHVPDWDHDGRLDYQEYYEDTNPYVYDKNNWEYAWDFCCGFLAGDFIADNDSIPLLVGQIVGSFVPLIDARDVVGNLVNNDPEMAMLSAVGLIPGGGDAAKAIGKFAQFVAKNALRTAVSAEALIRLSKHSDELAKIIGHSDEAKQLKLAIANGANDNITRPMVDKINDIVDSADKIEFKPKATLMDDVVEGLDVKKIVPSKSYDANAMPRGKETKITQKMTEENRRSLEYENNAAKVLARNGYDIEQNPVLTWTSKKPDYLIEGKIFDCYSPKGNTTVRNIASAIADKIERGQTNRVVLNLDDWNGDISEIVKQLTNYPIDGLIEVIATRSDTVISLYP